MRDRRRLLLAVLCLLPAAGCDDMRHQRKVLPWSDARGDPPPVPPHVVAFESRPEAPPLSLALLQRGQQRYRIFCAPCHGETGDGRGMIVQRGFAPTPDLADARIVRAPTQRYVTVIAQGTGNQGTGNQGMGKMYGFAQRIPPADRWAIAAYVRALQAARATRLADLSPGERSRLP
ncbi:cytochrome c [Nguyenibacter vanlangensis]|uniref:Cytochrome c n=1 Tax=Nguyenibacter vanlangensis TaxID=1216886 RepID=A0ABZ3D9I2_9PROT